MVRATSRSILEHFSALIDPHKQFWGLYPLLNIWLRGELLRIFCTAFYPILFVKYIYSL
jgi:hypothetical protein